MARKILTLIHCDYGNCPATAWVGEAAGWTRDGEKDYCPDHRAAEPAS